MGEEFQYQLVMAGTLTALLVYRCYYACERQRRPTRLYRRVRHEDEERLVENIVIHDTTQPQREETPPPEWDFDVRPPRAPRAFVGPAVHGACRAPTVCTGDAPRVAPPPPYSVIAVDAPTIGGPPPTYQEVVDLQRQENASRAADT